MNEIIVDSSWEELANEKIVSEHDIVKARQMVRHFAKAFRMGLVEQTRITTAVSELLRNMYQYANGGVICIHKGIVDSKNALIITCTDQGDGIDDVELAMSDGYTSGQGMGYGLPGAKRLVDRFEINSQKGVGTKIRIMKWR